MQGKTLWLVDGSSYIYRAFYALPPLTNNNGLPTGAIYGLIKMLLNLQAEQNPDFLCIALDPAGKTARHNIYKDYKANRESMPEELQAQMPYIEPILSALGFHTIKVIGEEADDVIGSLCKFAKTNGLNVRISSPDKDFAQLVDSDIILENTMSGKTLDYNGVITKFGVKPEQIIDYLALVGDTADNIPGIPKVGPKTACKWLNEYGSIKTIAQNLNKIKGAVGASLAENFGKIPLYQELVTIRTNLSLEVSLDDLKPKPTNTEELTAFYQELGFNTWLKQLPRKSEDPVEKFLSISEACEIRYHIHSGAVAIYPETDETFIATKNLTIKTHLSISEVLSELVRIDDIIIIGFSIKPWLNFNLNAIEVFDVQLAQYIIDSNIRAKNLALLAEHYALGELNSARVLFELYLLLEDKLAKNLLQSKLYYKLELPLSRVIQQMEHNGILLDVEKMQALSKEFSQEIESIVTEAHNYAKTNFNLSSPKQIREVLYDNLSLPIIKKTAKGEPSTSEDALTSLISEHPLPELILRHRQLSKLLSTYTSPLPRMVAADGRLHGEFSQVTTTTGRLASSNPNLQNIPVRTKQGQRIRSAFIAPEGHKLVSADYSQIELRIMAHLSQDDKLLEAFEHNLDVHSHTAANLFGCDISAVDKDQRRKAKAINFGLIYGMSAFGLSNQINCSRQHAKELIEHYFARYPGVMHYMEATRAFVRKHGYVETLMGRRLYLPDIKAGKHNLAQAAERAAINGPMQGTSADMIKQAMLNISPKLEEFEAKIILQVHDELIFEAPLTSVGPLANHVEREMLMAISLSVPLAVNVCTGDSWGSLKPRVKSLI